MRCYLKVRVAEKAMRDGRNISLRAVAREADVPLSTVNRLADNTIREIPVAALTKLCVYLQCQVGDLLTLVDTPESDQP